MLWLIDLVLIDDLLSSRVHDFIDSMIGDWDSLGSDLVLGGFNRRISLSIKVLYYFLSSDIRSELKCKILHYLYIDIACQALI